MLRICFIVPHNELLFCVRRCTGKNVVVVAFQNTMGITIDTFMSLLVFYVKGHVTRSGFFLLTNTMLTLRTHGRVCQELHRYMPLKKLKCYRHHAPRWGDEVLRRTPKRALTSSSPNTPCGRRGGHRGTPVQHKLQRK